MSYKTVRKALLQDRLKKVQAVLVVLYDNLTEQASQSVESYQFESGEGMQKAKRRDLSKLLREIAILQATESHLINELARMGLVSIRLRRKR